MKIQKKNLEGGGGFGRGGGGRGGGRGVVGPIRSGVDGMREVKLL